MSEAPVITGTRSAAVTASGLLQHLLVASNAELSREERRTAYERAWSAWPKLQRAMSTLSQVTPHSCEAGYDDDAEMTEWINQARAEGVRV